MTTRLKIAAALGAIVLVSACAPGPQPTKTDGTTVECRYPKARTPVKANEAPTTTNVPAVGTVTYTLKMTEGDVQLTLDRAAAPCTVHSFESLAKQGYFNDTVCHRVTDRGIFILQCGDPSATGRGGPGYSFADELTGDETYGPGTVAMANAGPNTNGSQFFLVYGDSPLEPKYTVFGSMDEASTEIIAGIGAKGVDAANAPKPISPAEISSVSAG